LRYFEERTEQGASGKDAEGETPTAAAGYEWLVKGNDKKQKR
jgi:hypothetical protein